MKTVLTLQNPWKGFWNPQGSLDHTLKTAVLLVLVGNAKISSKHLTTYPPSKKQKNKQKTHVYTTHRHTNTHIQGQFPHFFSKASLWETASQNNSPQGTSLAVQWLRLHPSTAGGTGSIPGWGTKIPQASQRDQKKIRTKQILCRDSAPQGRGQLILQMVASYLSTEPSESNKWLLEGLHLALQSDK